MFPTGGFPAGTGPTQEAASAFAEILGIGADYWRLLEVNQMGGEMNAFLCHFQNNLDLLIQKTWVEKADEIRKEKLQDRVPGFVAGIKAGNFQQALEEFGAILEELAYLLFGAQSGKEDFPEYTFRIDTQMGLFWWYGGRLGSLRSGGKHRPADAALQAGPGDRAELKALWAVLLIGICYLTNF
ncbi:MAG: hypothetical protein LBK27_02445 [Treponema sp.]|nr:hypothetical protein [Treponema sp.]